MLLTKIMDTIYLKEALAYQYFLTLYGIHSYLCQTFVYKPMAWELHISEHNYEKWAKENIAVKFLNYEKEWKQFGV